MNRRLIILGSTGSIGTQALDVVTHLNALHADRKYPSRFEVVGLAAGANAALLARQAHAFNCPRTALASTPSTQSGGTGMLPVSTSSASSAFSSSSPTFTGPSAAEDLIKSTDCDLVLTAMVGSAGLPATLAAIHLGRDIALANKETLVAAGEFVIRAARASGSRLLPVDSEHAGLWQCLQSLDHDLVPPLRTAPAIERVVLTASGGPFRTWTKDRIEHATPAEALNHPTWSMGPKVTIDSASLMNKALEIIEAKWLFNIEPRRIEAVIHPQSTVHALVEFADGSMVAQLSATNMRHPIQQALSWPHRVAPCSGRLDLQTLRSLEFEPPDFDRFPSLALAYRVMEQGGTSGAVFNAANEAAVTLFLASGDRGVGKRPIPFGFISRVVAEAMERVKPEPLTDLAAVIRADAAARRFVESRAVEQG